MSYLTIGRRIFLDGRLGFVDACREFDTFNALIELTTTANVATTPTVKPLVPFVYDEIPLGQITPNGWLKAEMETSASGLAGHLYDFYRYVHNSTWLGGTQEYSKLNEAFPYWYNALVPLAYTLNDPRLKSQVHDATDYLLKNMIADDGWIGPERDGYRLLWARTLIFFAWTPLVDANKTYEEPIVAAMHGFCDLMLAMLRNNGTGLIEQKDSVLSADYFFWHLSRVAETIVSLQWLYDKYPRGKEKELLESMELLHHYGYKWEDWYVNGTYTFDDLYALPEEVTDYNFQFLHGVNVGEGLKAAAVIRRYTYNNSLIETNRNAFQWTTKYHGAPSGTIIADERLAGLQPFYGAETCTAVEVMFSASYSYRALGEGFYADGAERAAYNALPGAMSGDWWSHVYVSQSNQPYSKNLTVSPFFNVNTMGQTYGLEPDYPCCTVNHPQGLPKFVQAAYAKVGEKGLVHALLSPGSVTTDVGGGSVTVECDTNYPFEDDLVYTINAEKPFDFYVRRPAWAAGDRLTYSAPEHSELSFDVKSSLNKISLPAGQSTIVYTVGAAIRTEPRFNDTVAVYRGALLYAAEIKADIKSTGPHNYRNLTLYPEGYAPDQAKDYVMLNASEWSFAIDPTTLEYHSRSAVGNADKAVPKVEPLPRPVFASGAPPMYMTVKACLIDWPLLNQGVPDVPIPLKDRICRGDVFEAKLVPYGSAKLRMTELPVIDLNMK